MTLTALGRQLAAQAEHIADTLHHADELIAHHHSRHHTRLRLGSFPTAGAGLLPEALAALRHQHPHAALSIIGLGPAEGISLVDARKLDVALIGEYTEPITAPTEVDLVPLLDDPIHAVLPTDRRLAHTPANQPLRLADFADDDWASAPNDLPTDASWNT